MSTVCECRLAGSKPHAVPRRRIIGRIVESNDGYTLRVRQSETRSHQRRPVPQLGALPSRYSFVLHPDVRDRFTRCPRCNAQTRLRKLPLVIHVEHPAGARLTILGKTCRLCVVCEMLIAHAADITQQLVASGVAAEGDAPDSVVLGTVAPRVWRAGLARGVTLEAVRTSMADFKQYMRVDVTPGGWYRDAEAPDVTLRARALRPRRPRRQS